MGVGGPGLGKKCWVSGFCGLGIRIWGLNFECRVSGSGCSMYVHFNIFATLFISASTGDQCRANLEHTRQSRPDYGAGLSHFQYESPSKLSSCFLPARQWCSGVQESRPHKTTTIDSRQRFWYKNVNRKQPWIISAARNPLGLRVWGLGVLLGFVADWRR